MLTVLARLNYQKIIPAREKVRTKILHDRTHYRGRFFFAILQNFCEHRCRRRFSVRAGYSYSTHHLRDFAECFERFGEFPSYLFDNENGIDDLLSQTIEDLQKDPAITIAMKKGIDLLLGRLPSQDIALSKLA